MSNLKSLEFSTLIITIIIASFGGIGLNVALRISGMDTLEAILFSFFLGFISIIIFTIIFNYEKEMPFSLKLKKLYGPFFGSIINYFFILIAFIVGTIYMYNLINFTLNHYLFNTPIFIIAIIYLFLIIYTNFKGLTTIARMAFILLIINLILFSFPFFNLIPKTNINNFKPFLANGLNNVIKSAFNLFFLTINNIFILLVIPKSKFKDNKKTNKYIIFAYIISMIIIFFITFITLNILGPRLVLFYQDPEYIVLKQVNLFNFLNRIENIISMQWLNGLYISLSVIIYFISNSIKYNNNNKYISIIIGIIILFSSLLSFKNDTTFANFILKCLPVIHLISFMVMIIICLTIIIKTKKIMNKSLF